MSERKLSCPAPPAHTVPVSGFVVIAIALRMRAAFVVMLLPSAFICWMVARVGSTSVHALHPEPTLAKSVPFENATDVVACTSPSLPGVTSPWRTFAIAPSRNRR